MAEPDPVPALPWLAAPLRRTLETRRGHALLLHGPGGVGQFELGLLVAKGWLCESESVPLGSRPCGVCAGCRLVAARSHPDLLVLLPEALRESLGWTFGDDDGGGEERAAAKKKPSKDIRVEDVRAAVATALTTSSRGRGKVVVLHPAERMNAIAANAFLKTLEEPAGDARFVLCSGAADLLAPTIRSRCQAVALGLPPVEEALAWLAAHGVKAGDALLAASGGQPQDALALARLGIDGEAWLALPGRVAAGQADALKGWPLPTVVDALQKLCHDLALLAAGASPRYFPASSLRPAASLEALLAWAKELRRFAAQAEHPWNGELAVEALVQQGREALQTPRSPGAGRRVESLHSVR